VSANTTGFTAIETDVTTVKVESLLPNTQYIVYATALTYIAGGLSNATAANNNNNSTLKKVESEPSETLVAWTDPAFPAFVEVRMVKSVPQKNTFSNLVSFIFVLLFVDIISYLYFS
jgi:hypothetical protein